MDCDYLEHMSFLLSSQGLRTHFIALHFPARHMDFRQTLVYGAGLLAV